MIAGRYVLLVGCNAPGCAEARELSEDYPVKDGGAAFRALFRAARAAGWELDLQRGLALCPACQLAGRTMEALRCP